MWLNRWLILSEEGRETDWQSFRQSTNIYWFPTLYGSLFKYLAKCLKKLREQAMAISRWRFSGRRNKGQGLSVTGSGWQWGRVLRDECKEKIGDLTVAVPAETLIFIVNRMGKCREFWRGVRQFSLSFNKFIFTAILRKECRELNGETQRPGQTFL